jgi:hypothetical protein
MEGMFSKMNMQACNQAINKMRKVMEVMLIISINQKPGHNHFKSTPQFHPKFKRKIKSLLNHLKLKLKKKLIHITKKE